MLPCIWAGDCVSRGVGLPNNFQRPREITTGPQLVATHPIPAAWSLGGVWCCFITARIIPLAGTAVARLRLPAGPWQ